MTTKQFAIWLYNNSKIRFVVLPPVFFAHLYREFEQSGFSVQGDIDLATYYIKIRKLKIFYNPTHSNGKAKVKIYAW